MKRPKMKPAVLLRVIERDGPCCRYCGTVPLPGAVGFGWVYDARQRLRVMTWGWHLDHVIPLSEGGLDAETKLVLACEACNLRKGARAPAPMLPRYPFTLGPPTHTPAFGTLNGLHA